MNGRTAKIPANKNGQILPYYRFKNKTCATIPLKNPSDNRCIDDHCKQTPGNGNLLPPASSECATQPPDYPECMNNFVACETAHIQK
ncbi:MAG: hypothetical protein DU489_03925 [Nitrosomonas sp.]